MVIINDDNDKMMVLVPNPFDNPASAVTTTTSPAGWCPKQLAGGDTLASLSAQYFPNLAEREGARFICEANGIPFNIQAINAWVISNGGRWLPHVAGTPVIEGSPTGGWAVFTSTSKILLPCKGTVEPGKPAPPVTTVDDTDGYSWWWLLAAGLGTGAAYMAFREKPKPRRKRKRK